MLLFKYAFYLLRVYCDQYKGFTKKQFREMLNLYTKHNIFVFESKLHKHFDGAAMGGMHFPFT